MDKLCETINRQCCLYCEMECDGKWLETEIEMYKEDLLKKQADKIADLEAKLAESSKEWLKICKKHLDDFQKKCREVDQLKQQLATQRNEIYETVINAMTKHWEDIMSKSGWWLNCGKCKDMEKFFKSVIIDNKIPLTRQETEINFILEHQIKELKGEK